MAPCSLLRRCRSAFQCTCLMPSPMRFCISRVFAARRKACEFRGGRRIWGFLSWPPIVCALLRHPGQRKARQPDQRVHKPWAPRLVCMCFGSAADGCAEAVPEVVVGLPSGSAHRYLSGAAALGTTGLFSRRPPVGWSRLFSRHLSLA